MKETAVWFSCDVDNCEERSLSMSNATLARKVAKQVGWKFFTFPKGYDRSAETKSYCPEHAS